MRLLAAILLASTVMGAAATANAFTVVNNGTTAYTIDGVDNPTLNLVRGQTYTFNITATGHPFYIKTVQSTGTGNQYTTGVTGNGTTSGALVWTVDNGAPATLFYDCSIHGAMTGQIHITNAVPGTTPLSAAVLLLLLAGIGLVYSRRRTLLAWLTWVH